MESAGDHPVLISALEHWSYCPRQCGLIHLEQTYTENLYTVRGNHAHEHAHTEGGETSGDVRVVRGISLWSAELGLVGKADVVEFRDRQPFPVEYKVGQRRKWGHEDIQLAAQAMCLEEMLELSVPEGAIFYSRSQRRRVVTVDDSLRALVRQTVESVRAMLAGNTLPGALDDARCPSCSLNDACLPDVVARSQRMKLHHTALFKADSWSESTEASGGG